MVFEDLKPGSAICLRKINSFYPSLQLSLLPLRELIAYREDLSAREIQNPEKHLEEVLIRARDTPSKFPNSPRARKQDTSTYLYTKAGK